MPSLTLRQRGVLGLAVEEEHAAALDRHGHAAVPREQLGDAACAAAGRAVGDQPLAVAAGNDAEAAVLLGRVGDRQPDGEHLGLVHLGQVRRPGPGASRSAASSDEPLQRARAAGARAA